MKNFNDIMSKKTKEIKAIIGELPNEFDSHYFIQKFAQKFQREYIEMLNLYIDNGVPFQTVNQQISSFLAKNEDNFGIKGQGKISSQNIFGNNSECERWLKN
ncbi:MAG TPA: hypothetical protein PLK02_00210 [Paludibacteraceae bacterium]|nr:hypothetical protein [Paludibacteraceae bacterium]